MVLKPNVPYGFLNGTPLELQLIENDRALELALNDKQHELNIAGVTTYNLGSVFNEEEQLAAQATQSLDEFMVRYAVEVGPGNGKRYAPE